MKYLGETFDIHGGGLDLKFPHHENEIAQAESATGKPFARLWLHHGLTRFNTKKISKSDPEFAKIMQSLQLTELLKKHNPELLRFLIILSQYRSPIDFSDESLVSAEKGLNTFYRLIERLGRVTEKDPYDVTLQLEAKRGEDLSDANRDLMTEVLEHRVRFLEAMDDDFNTAAAVAVLFDVAGAINRYLDEFRLETHPDEPARSMAQAAGGSFIFLARLLGLLVEPPRKQGDDGRTPQLLDLLVDVRRMAREAKQFQLADHVRDRLAELGVVLEDRKDGTGWRIE